MTERRQSSRRRDATSTQSPEPSLPHSLEAERSVLGVLITHNDAYDSLSHTLSVGHFYRVSHQLIFRAITALRERGSAVDFVTVREELIRSGCLDDAGGPAYISSLTDGIPRSTNLDSYSRIVIEKARLCSLIHVANAILTEAYAAEEPADAIIANADRELLNLQIGHVGQMRSLADTGNARYKEHERRSEHRGELRGVGTGFQSLDELTLGLRPGDLDILAARTSIGKSSLAMNIAVNAARTGKRVAVFSLEMTREQIEDRILAQLSGVALSRIQSGHLSPADFTTLTTALEEMHTLPIHIDDGAGQTAADVRQGCRRIQRESGPVDLIIVDYVQLQRSMLTRKGASRSEELSDTAQREKELAKELGVPVLLLSQLRRHDGRPQLSDLRESGALEQIADIVMFLHRKDHRVSGPTELIVAKQRNGATGSLSLSLDRDVTTFTDCGDASHEPAVEEQATPPPRARRRTFASRYGG